MSTFYSNFNLYQTFHQHIFQQQLNQIYVHNLYLHFIVASICIYKSLCSSCSSCGLDKLLFIVLRVTKFCKKILYFIV